MHMSSPTSPEPSPAPVTGDLGQRLYRGILAALLLYFVAKLLFFAVSIRPELPPDEVTHIGRAHLFAQALWIPDDGPATWRYGLIEGKPFLYYVLMGKTLQLFGWLPLSDVLLLRLVNAVLGLVTVLYGLRWIRLMTPNRIVHLLFAAILTNILMFTGICAAVSYDNLTNALAAMALFYTFAFFRDRSAESLAKGQLALAAGALTKFTFLPLLFIVEVVLVAREGRRLAGTWSEVRAALRPAQGARGRRVLFAVTAVVGFGAAGFYGTNLLVFGHLTPKPEQVLTLEQAMQNRIFARNFIVKQFKEGNLTYEQAVELTRGIHNPGNRHRARNLLALARDPDRLQASLMGPVEYVWAWGNFMLADGLGYHGHKVMRKWGKDLYPVLILLLLVLVLFIRKWQPEDAGGGWTAAAIIAFFYAMVLLWVVNYRVYLGSGMLDYALQGRYIFPVLIPIVGIVAYYLVAFLPRRSQVLVALLVGGYFVYGELPFFLDHSNRAWFSAGLTMDSAGLEE
ncbi:MAG: hypothetical protein KDD11_13250 [Acidobacteria bacterium]|nr:hypothetical protein [Acidobacteriota bacterium]